MDSLTTHDSPRRRGKIVSRSGVALAFVGLASLLAACGGGSAPSSAPTTTTVPGTASLAAYSTCLTSHGVPASVVSALSQRRGPVGGDPTATTTPGGSAGTPGGSAGTPGGSAGTPATVLSQYRSAIQACRSLLPFRPGGGLNNARFAAYRNCLQLHGVTLPTPTTVAGQPPSTGGGFFGDGGGGGGQLASNPAFQAAQKACAALLPARNPGSSSTTTAQAS